MDDMIRMIIEVVIALIFSLIAYAYKQDMNKLERGLEETKLGMTSREDRNYNEHKDIYAKLDEVNNKAIASETTIERCKYCKGDK